MQKEVLLLPCTLVAVLLRLCVAPQQGTLHQVLKREERLLSILSGPIQGKAGFSSSTFRDRQPNEGLSDVQTSLTFERC